MSLRIRKSDLFIADFDRQFCWYDQEAGWEVACGYLDATDASLEKLAGLPDLGSITHFVEPELQGLRFLPVNRPCNTHLIFYRADSTTIEAWRIVHGARDLPRRLLEPPGTE